MKKTKASIVGIAVFLVLIGAVSGVDTTAVKVEPATQSVLSGESFSVNVTVEDVTDMAADGAILHFDPDAMQATDITAGVITTSPIEDIDNTAGTVTFGYALMTGSFSGSGPLATIEFTTNASAEGTFNLNLTDVELLEPNQDVIPTDVFNDTVSLDKTPPIMTILTSIEGKNYSSICIKLNITTEDAKSRIGCMWYSPDGGESVMIEDVGNVSMTVYGEAVISDLAPCEHSIVLSVNDTVGKVSYSEVSFNVYPGDIDFNGKVYVSDLLLLAQAYNSKPDDDNWNENADLNCDSRIYTADLLMLAQNYSNDYEQICGIVE